MKKNILRIGILLSTFFIIFQFQSLKANPDSLLIILQNELDREFKAFNDEEQPPYYISFRVDHLTSNQVEVSHGNILSNNKSTNRIFTPQVRIGSYQFDDTHEFDEGNNNYFPGLFNFGISELPIENNPLAIKHSIWLALDKTYKNSLRTYNIKQNLRKEGVNDTIGDFSKAESQTYYEAPLSPEEMDVDEKFLIRKLKEISLILGEDTSVFSTSVSLKYGTNRKYFISTEGTSIVQNTKIAQLQIVTVIRNKDGNIYPQHTSIIGKCPVDLLSDESINDEIANMLALIEKIKSAKPAEPFAGPAILSPEAAGVFFHEIFGHRIEGHRLERSYDGQTFTDKIGQRVLPKSFSVISDPTLEKYGIYELIGTYSYDDEGIKSERVNVVKEGVLNHFLMSRKPLSTIKVSNGHGRAAPGSIPVSRQSNLIVESSKGYTEKELRKRLISECKKQKKEYGYYFKSVIEGFTITDRYNPNVFNIIPSEVYRIYVDGRPDELVVGVELIGTPLTMFSNILYAGDSPGFFSGFCGAESGFVPVSTVSPAIFVKKIETQKGIDVKSELPILPSPAIINNF